MSTTTREVTLTRLNGRRGGSPHPPQGLWTPGAPSRRSVLAGAAGLGGTALLAGCAGAGTSPGGGSDSIDVLMVNNPQMIDLQALTEEHFTRPTGIRVNYTVLPENDVRDKIAQEFSSQAGTYDVASISNYETPFYSQLGWILPLDEFFDADPDFDQADILPSMSTALTGDDGRIYAEPFYGESSFLMYRADVFEQLGIELSAQPTWEEVAEIAARIDRNVPGEPGMRGIALRGQPGWGQVFAPLTTVVNTFGGTWFEEDWTSRVNAPEFVEATSFYVDLVRTHSPLGSAQAGFAECLNALTQGQAAMWYDATSAAGSLDAEDSPVAGRMGYAPAPVKETESSGWLFAWSWAIQTASTKRDAAWRFISWASGKEYEELVGNEVGWASVPSGKRTSTYENSEYRESAGPFWEPTQQSILAAKPDDPGVQPRPAPGIQFVAIPEFANLGTLTSQGVSAAIAGSTTVEEALDTGQELATTQVTERYQS
ncbi:sugar ABC transporter substrate-binding protein [Kineococcus vitellinus]|uniref:ABC transporter substrate-binding protein n=1 Tax=Kineococcus vitellinus TaxID=2696565 RepID=UPI0030B846DC